MNPYGVWASLTYLGLFSILLSGCESKKKTDVAVMFTIHPCITAPYCIYDEATGTAACEPGYVRAEPDSEVNFECVECALVTCEDAEAQCGSLNDGCGGMLECGQCLDSEECGIETPNQCTNTSCESIDCEHANAECGAIDNGCGRT